MIIVAGKSSGSKSSSRGGMGYHRWQVINT